MVAVPVGDAENVARTCCIPFAEPVHAPTAVVVVTAATLTPPPAGSILMENQLVPSIEPWNVMVPVQVPLMSTAHPEAPVSERATALFAVATPEVRLELRVVMLPVADTPA
jgi:hypothetical protein